MDDLTVPTTNDQMFVWLGMIFMTQRQMADVPSLLWQQCKRTKSAWKIYISKLRVSSLTRCLTYDWHAVDEKKTKRSLHSFLKRVELLAAGRVQRTPWWRLMQINLVREEVAGTQKARRKFSGFLDDYLNDWLCHWMNNIHVFKDTDNAIARHPHTHTHTHTRS